MRGHYRGADAGLNEAETALVVERFVRPRLDRTRPRLRQRCSSRSRSCYAATPSRASTSALDGGGGARRCESGRHRCALPGRRRRLAPAQAARARRGRLRLHGIGHLTRDGKVACLNEIKRVSAARPVVGVRHAGLVSQLALAVAFHVFVGGIAIWSILLVVLVDGSSVDEPYAAAIFIAAVALWFATPFAMMHWRRSHPRGLWLLPVACVAVVAAVVLTAAAARSVEPGRRQRRLRLPPAELVEHRDERAAARVLLARGAGECDDLVAPPVGLRCLAHGAQVADGAAVALAIRRLELGCDEQPVVLERRVEIVDGCDPRELEPHRHRHRQPRRGPSAAAVAPSASSAVTSSPASPSRSAACASCAWAQSRSASRSSPAAPSSSAVSWALGARVSSVAQERNGVAALIGVQIGDHERLAQRLVAGAVLGHAALQPVERVVAAVDRIELVGDADVARRRSSDRAPARARAGRCRRAHERATRSSRAASVRRARAPRASRAACASSLRVRIVSSAARPSSPSRSR